MPSPKSDAPGARNRIRLSLAVLALALCAQPAYGQEVQVPVDTAGRLLEIERALAVRLGEFVDEYPDLQVARLFRAADNSYIVELTLRRDQQTLRQRIPITEAEVHALRERVSAQLALAPALPEELDQDGRTLLIAGASMLGVGFYGWAVPVVLDLEDEGVVAAYMLTTAASILFPYLHTSEREVTFGMTNAWWWGATRGIVHGAELVGLLDEDASGETLAAATLAGSLVEGIAGYVWAQRSGMSAGTAHTIGISSDIGQAWAGNLMMIVQPDGGRIVFGGLLAGGVAGLAAGTWYDARRDHTWGDAEVLRAASVAGALDGLAIWDLLADDEDSETTVRILGAALLAGSAAGIVYADRQLSDVDFTAGEGVIIDLAGIAGYATGIGIGLLIAEEEAFDINSELLNTLGAVGATAGVVLGMRTMSDQARRRDRRRRDEGRLDLQLNPWALAAAASPRLGGVLGRPAVAPVPLPFLSVRYTF